MIIDDDDELSLSHHHHNHHQFQAAYLQLAGKSPTIDGHRTLSEPETVTAGCDYCAVPTAGAGPDFPGDGATSAGVDADGDGPGRGMTCGRCGHRRCVHTHHHGHVMNSSGHVTGGQRHHCRHYQRQQQDVI